MMILDNKLTESIHNAFDSVNNESLESSGKYVIKCFSVFDHWLSEKEAEGQIFFYEHAIEKFNSNESKQYFMHHDNLMNFYISLFNKMIVYGVLYDERGASKFVEFNSFDEYTSHVLPSVRE